MEWIEEKIEEKNLIFNVSNLDTHLEQRELVEEIN